MTWEEWEDLKHGNKIRHKDGDVETVYEWEGAKYIEGEKMLFPLDEFNYKEWERVKERR